MKKQVQFLWKVNGDFSPQDLQKVFLAGHPSDTAQRQQLMEEILSLFDCAVFWHEDIGRWKPSIPPIWTGISGG